MTPDEAVAYRQRAVEDSYTLIATSFVATAQVLDLRWLLFPGAVIAFSCRLQYVAHRRPPCGSNNESRKGDRS